MTDLITAGELREMGLPIPESIPDCASIPRSAMKWTVVDAATTADDKTVVLKLNVAFTANFEWVQLDIVLGPEP